MDTDVPIREVMTRDYVGVSESDTIDDTVALMRESRSSSAVVLRGEDAVGIVTEWDLVGLLEAEDPSTDAAVSTVMSSPVVSARADATLAEAAATMTAEGIRNLLVTESREFVGVLTQRDVIAAISSRRATSDREARTPTAATGGAGEGDRVAIANGGDAFRRQGICEGCGALADALWEENGQFRCENCHGV
jgi:CBS domain-containing protein